MIRSRKASARARGVVLILVLWVLAVLTVLCLALHGAVQVHHWQLRRLAAQGQSDQAGRSAVAIGQAVLLADDPSADTLGEPWAQDRPETMRQALNGGELLLFTPGPAGARAGLRDEAACLNANTVPAAVLARLPGMSLPAAEDFVARRSELAEQIAAARAALEPAPNAVAAGLTGPIADEATLAAVLAASLSGTSVAAAAVDGQRPWENPRELPDPVAGVLRHLTIHSRVRNVDARDRPRVDLNSADRFELASALGDTLGSDVIIAIIQARITEPFGSIGDLLLRELPGQDLQGRPVPLRVTRAQFAAIADRLTVTRSPVLVGHVNVNTAPREVLQCLPGLTLADVDAILRARAEAGADRSSLAWLLDVLPDETFAQACGLLTTRSQQFAADFAFHPDRDDAATYGRVVFERDRGRCAVLILESRPATWADPRGG